MANDNAVRLFTPIAILSYPHLDVPQKNEQDASKPAKYSCSLIFTPEVLADPAEKARFELMQKAAVAAINAKWPGKLEELLQSEGFKKGFRRDWKVKGYPEGSIYVNVRSNTQPGIVYAHADPSDPKRPANMPLDKIKAEMYPGAIVRASVTAFAFDNSGNKGVSFGLNNIQKLREGTRLDNRVAAENDFDVDLSQAPVSLEDML